MYQQDPRHVDVVVQDLGIERGISMQTPAVHDVTDDEPRVIGSNPIQRG